MNNLDTGLWVLQGILKTLQLYSKGPIIRMSYKEMVTRSIRSHVQRKAKRKYRLVYIYILISQHYGLQISVHVIAQTRGMKTTILLATWTIDILLHSTTTWQKRFYQHLCNKQYHQEVLTIFKLHGTSGKFNKSNWQAHSQFLFAKKTNVGQSDIENQMCLQHQGWTTSYKKGK